MSCNYIEQQPQKFILVPELMIDNTNQYNMQCKQNMHTERCVSPEISVTSEQSAQTLKTNNSDNVELAHYQSLRLDDPNIPQYKNNSLMYPELQNYDIDIYDIDNIRKIIKLKTKWAKKELNVIREIYHYINTKYWTLSIIVIILSSILTIVESVKLIIIDTSNKYLDNTGSIVPNSDNDNTIMHSISKYSLNWNLACDILSLFTGATITLIMSLIRFNKYQTKLEFISNRILQLTTYKSNIILMQYKVDKIGFNLKEIKAEFLKLEENIYKDSELDKIISENEEAQFRRNIEKIEKRGPYRNYLYHVLSKYLCCRFRSGNNTDKKPNCFKCLFGNTKTQDNDTKTQDNDTKTQDNDTKTQDNDTKTQDNDTKTQDNDTKTQDNDTKTQDNDTKKVEIAERNVIINRETELGDYV